MGRSVRTQWVPCAKYTVNRVTLVLESGVSSLVVVRIKLIIVLVDNIGWLFPVVQELGGGVSVSNDLVVNVHDKTIYF